MDVWRGGNESRNGFGLLGRAAQVDEHGCAGETIRRESRLRRACASGSSAAKSISTPIARARSPSNPMDSPSRSRLSSTMTRPNYQMIAQGAPAIAARRLRVPKWRRVTGEVRNQNPTSLDAGTISCAIMEMAFSISAQRRCPGRSLSVLPICPHWTEKSALHVGLVMQVICRTWPARSGIARALALEALIAGLHAAQAVDARWGQRQCGLSHAPIMRTACMQRLCARPWRPHG